MSATTNDSETASVNTHSNPGTGAEDANQAPAGPVTMGFPTGTSTQTVTIAFPTGTNTQTVTIAFPTGTNTPTTNSIIKTPASGISSTSSPSITTSHSSIKISTSSSGPRCVPNIDIPAAFSDSTSPTAIKSQVPSSAVIGGSVAGTLVSLLAIGICIFCILHRRRRIHDSNTRITPLDGYSSQSLGPKTTTAAETGKAHHDGIISNSPLLMESAHLGYESDSLPTVAPGHPFQNSVVPEEQTTVETVDDVRNQVASIHATMARMMDHVRRIEAQIEEPPPTYISSD